MEFFISVGIISIIIKLITSIIIKGNGKSLIKNLSEEHVIIKVPFIYIAVGFVCSGTFMLFSVWMIATDALVGWVLGGFAFFILLGIYIVVMSIMWKIEIFRKEKYFLYRSSFFKTHKVWYDDCLYYIRTNNGLVIKNKDFKIHVDIFSVNYEYLLIMLQTNSVPESKK